jgi:hypothetical protein
MEVQGQDLTMAHWTLKSRDILKCDTAKQGLFLADCLSYVVRTSLPTRTMGQWRTEWKMLRTWRLG